MSLCLKIWQSNQSKVILGTLCSYCIKHWLNWQYINSTLHTDMENKSNKSLQVAIGNLLLHKQLLAPTSFHFSIHLQIKWMTNKTLQAKGFKGLKTSTKMFHHTLVGMHICTCNVNVNGMWILLLTKVFTLQDKSGA